MHTTKIKIKIVDSDRELSGVLKIHTATNDERLIEDILIGKIAKAVGSIRPKSVGQLVNYLGCKELFHIGAETFDTTAEINLVTNKFKLGA